MSALTWINLSYIAAGIGFILSIKWMNSPITARRGVSIGAVAMTVAVIATLFRPGVIQLEWIAVTIVVGSLASIPLALFMPMTAVPQRTALSHAFGSLAVLLIGIAKMYQVEHSAFAKSAILFETLLGGVTFSASLLAFAKLQDLMTGRPLTYRGQKWVNFLTLFIAVGSGVATFFIPASEIAYPMVVGFSLLFGIFLIIPIGGADMPTVLALLNSYAGLSAAAMGFVLNNKLLIVAGALDGASGFILAVVMCRAMNRSFTNLLFGAFGQSQASQHDGALETRSVRSASAEEAADILKSSERVIIIPGYGMAVAQAQHKASEIYELLTERGIDVKFAIHPVAGRMPGHMNVLLAEADIPYERLIEMDEINSEFNSTDVALVIGANDVTNPAAKNDPKSPVYGMPILEVADAKTVMVIKRGMNVGFAGIENELYFMDKTLMLFGDAKAFLADIIKHLDPK